MEKTKQSFFAESDSNEIKNLAKRITGKRKGREAAKRIFEWVRDEVRYDVADVVGAKGVLERRPLRAVCIDKANLMVALSRASGMTARYIGLDVKLKSKKEIPVLKHMIAEVYYNHKWHKLDPSFGKSCARLIPSSEFERIANWQSKSKETRFDSLPWFIPFFTFFLYRLAPTFVKLKKVFADRHA